KAELVDDVGGNERARLGAALHPALKVDRGVLAAEVQVAFAFPFVARERPLARLVASVTTPRKFVAGPMHAARAVGQVRFGHAGEDALQVSEEARVIRFRVALPDVDARLTTQEIRQDSALAGLPNRG